MPEENNKVKGYKLDEEKNMLGLLEPEFFEGIGLVATMGFRKYGLDNWKRNLERVRIASALLRHVFKYLAGERFDKESGLSHTYHAGWNLMALDFYDRRDNITDTRALPNNATANDKFNTSENDKLAKNVKKN